MVRYRDNRLHLQVVPLHRCRCHRNHRCTCRFGKDPASSVLDVDCKAHTVPNLYVSDSSFMPTLGAVPITLTIMANAFRVGSRIAERFKAGAL